MITITEKFKRVYFFQGFFTDNTLWYVVRVHQSVAEFGKLLGRADGAEPWAPFTDYCCVFASAPGRERTQGGRRPLTRAARR